jgi:hypothetical protein
MPRLLPFPEQSNASKSDDAIVSKEAQYEILQDPGSFVTGVMNAICHVRLGMVELKSDGKCTRDACSVRYHQEVSYSDRSVYITPQFTVALSDRIPSPGFPAHFGSVKSEWPSSVPFSGRVMVESDITLHDLPSANASLLSECVEKVGKLVLGRFRLYELGSMVAKLPSDKQGDYIVNQSTLGDLDLSLLQLLLPKSIKNGSAFTLEARLIPSSVLTAEIPNIDPHTVDGEARTAFEELTSLIKTEIPRDGVSLAFEFKLSNYRMLKLETKNNEIIAAAVKLIGDDVTATALTPEHQPTKPFNASVWSWSIKPSASGERSAYLSIEAKRADGNVISSVVPLRFIVQENIVQAINRFVSANWQWIAGTLVIPGLVFLLSKIGGKKPAPSGQPQQPLPEKRQQRDRSDSRRRR